MFDTFTATSGTFSASSANGGATLTFGISGGTAGNTVLGGVTFDVSNTGPFGTLYVDSRNGAFTFVPNSGAINALQAPTTESFTITVLCDGTLSASRCLHHRHQRRQRRGHHFRHRGRVPRSRPGASRMPTPGTPIATGTLTDTDVDNPPNTFKAVTARTASDERLRQLRDGGGRDVDLHAQQ